MRRQETLSQLGGQNAITAGRLLERGRLLPISTVTFSYKGSLLPFWFRRYGARNRTRPVLVPLNLGASELAPLEFLFYICAPVELRLSPLTRESKL